MADELPVTTIRSLEEGELRQHFTALSEQQRAHEFFYDSNTGLADERAWEVMKAGKIGPPLFAQYSIEGVAWVNDSFGHDAGQMLYRAAAEALHKVDTRVAKVRGDFAGRVESAADADLFARWAERKLPPEFQGCKITAAVGTTWEEAQAAHDAKKDELVKSGARAPRKTRPLGLAAGWSPTMPAHWGPPTPERPVPGRVEQPLHYDLHEAYRQLDRQVSFDLAYRDPMTGLLGHTGMGVTQQRGDQILSIDVDGLRATDRYQSALGDEVVKRVGTVMARLQEAGGVPLNAAHPHGDEYGASHPDARVLRGFAERLKAALAKETVTYTDVAIGKTYTQRGIGISYGIGRTADLAEAELKRDKAERVALGERDTKGETLIAEGRLISIRATPEQMERARANQAGGPQQTGRAGRTIDTVALGADGPVVARIRGARQPATVARARGARDRGRGGEAAAAVSLSARTGRCAALQERGIRPETLQAFAGRWREDDAGQAVFPRETWMRGADGERRVVPVGIEVAGKAGATVGRADMPGVWDSGEKPGSSRVVIVERAVDALSHYQMTADRALRASTRYIATTAASLSLEQQRLIADLVTPGVAVVAAFARSRDGENRVSQLEAAMPPRVRVVRDAPTRGAGWSDALQAQERDYIRSQGVRAPARGIERER